MSENLEAQSSKLEARSNPPAPKAQPRKPLYHRIRQQGPQFLRYIGVGLFNTLFGYTLFAVFLTLLNRAVPGRFLYLTVVLASVLSTPINITVAWLGYKFFVFGTQGNYLREWLKCFAVYGASMVPGLIALSGLTRALQAFFEHHRLGLPYPMQKPAAPGYCAGAIVTGFTVIFSFIGHKRVTFHRPPA